MRAFSELNKVKVFKSLLVLSLLEVRPHPDFRAQIAAPLRRRR